MKKNQTTEGLDEYIRVGKPGTLIILTAMLIVLAAVIIWGLIGKLPVKETIKGLVVNTEKASELYGGKVFPDFVKETYTGKTYIYCFIDASRFNVMQVDAFGKEAVLEMPDHGRFTGRIIAFPGVPLSTLRCQEILFGNEWVTERCVKTDYSWFLLIEPDEDISKYEFMLADVTIVTEQVAPITFLTAG